MDFSLASFIAGLLGGGILLFYIQHRYPGMLPSSQEGRLLSQIDTLESRLNKKDELIRKAVLASKEGQNNETD